MFFTVEEAGELREYVKKILREHSDADPEVLAEYVVALLQADDAPEQVKRGECENGLQEFLKGNVAVKVVGDIFDAIHKKAYKPGYVPPPKANPKPKLRPSAAEFNPGAASFSHAPPNGPANGVGKSKKRGYNEVTDEVTRTGAGTRAMKQARRNNGTIQAGNVPTMPAAMVAQTYGPGQQQMAFPGMPPFDPNDPHSMMIAMQAMMQAMAQFSATMGMAVGTMPDGHQRPGRCRDYDTVGYCAKGGSCPYQHGDDKIIVPQDQTISNPFTTNVTSNKPTSKRRDKRNNKADKRERKNKNDKRSEFSAFGDTADPTNTKLVVENIPRDHASEDAVTAFFEQFGAVEAVELLGSRRVAIVTFSEHESAREAWRSHKVIFDDRFVRVFWHKSDYEMSEVHQSYKEEEEEPVDPVELQRRIDEAQKTYEDKMRRQEEVRVQREELERRMRDHAVERRKLMQALRAKEKKQNGAMDEGSGSELDDEDVELRDKLLALEAEAELLGLDPNDPLNSMSASLYGGYRGRGRGGYRGRNRGRGRGYSRGGGRGGGVLRLDNRTKSISINIAAGSEEDEKMRQLLLTHFDVDSIEPHPSDSTLQIITFKERYLAEEFASKARVTLDQPELSWYTPGTSKSESDATMQHSDEEEANRTTTKRWQEERDLDIADDE